MAFSTNYKNLDNLMEKGEYEFVISDAYEKRPEGATPYLSLMLVVRNDVEQVYQNKAIFLRRYLSENALPYTEQAINTISKCVGLPEGAKFDSIDRWGDAVRGLPIRACVKHREYNGDYYADISYYKRSESPECGHVWKDDSGDGARRIPGRQTQAQQTAVHEKPQVNEDELPF